LTSADRGSTRRSEKNGNWLDGGKSYGACVPANQPVIQFWSFTLYDNVTCGSVVTDQGAADLSLRQSLVEKAAGSVDLCIGPSKPALARDLSEDDPRQGLVPVLPLLWAGSTPTFDKSWQLNYSR
jgi:hypothetical protein